MILGCFGPRLTLDEKSFFAEAQPWGFILFARNFETPDQARRLTSALRDSVGREAPILIDQEGGRVQRIGPPHWRQFLPPLDQVTAGRTLLMVTHRTAGLERMDDIVVLEDGRIVARV